MKHFFIMTSLFGLLAVFSCKKMINVGPPKTQLTVDKAFADDNTALSVISNIYAQFNATIDNGITTALGTYVDELTISNNNQDQLEFYNGFVSPANNINLNIWKGLYSVIYQCNAVLENIPTSPGISLAMRSALKSEALFLRSLAYFHLVNLYGNVPMLLTTDVHVTSTAPRTPSSTIATQIVADLIVAQSLSAVGYPSAEKVRANKWAIVALLSKVYLYQQNWTAAETNADSIITSNQYMPLDNPSSAFLKNSKESILQFWTQNGFTVEGSLFNPSAGAIPTYTISPILMGSIEPGDVRKNSWFKSVVVSAQTYYYPFKYKNRTSTTGASAEYLNLMRLSELYLIRAEARAMQDNVTGAQADLNFIRTRAALNNTTAGTKSELLTAILQERRIELCFEWANRFFDLKRAGQLNNTMMPLKPLWKSTSALLPIPQYELLNNPLLDQNPGY